MDAAKLGCIHFLYIINICFIRIHMRPHPCDRLCDALRKRILLLPVCQFADLGIAAEQTVYLALFRAQALLVADDTRIRVDL